MTEDTLNVKEEPRLKVHPKNKRDIIRFGGDKSTAINLDHVTCMYIDGKKISFEFYTKLQFVEFEDETSAKTAFESLVAIWAGDIQ